MFFFSMVPEERPLLYYIALAMFGKGSTMRTHRHGGMMVPRGSSVKSTQHHLKKIFDPHKSADLKGIPDKVWITQLFISFWLLCFRPSNIKLHFWLVCFLALGVSHTSERRARWGPHFFSNQSSLEHQMTVGFMLTQPLVHSPWKDGGWKLEDDPFILGM